MNYEYLKCITPIDGRYKFKTGNLEDYFSEMSFNKYRLYIEIEYLISLGELKIFNINDDMSMFLRNIYNKFSFGQCIKLKKIEEEINHDVKALEYYIRKYICEKYTTQNNSKSILNFIHFGLTSQDINSSANILMIKDSISKEIYPLFNEISNIIEDIGSKWSHIPMLAKTHGQPASPTFMGKEFFVFNERLQKQFNILKNISYTTKFGGAIGNLNAHYISLPTINWINFSDSFVKKIGLVRNKYTTQIDHYDNYSEIFDCIKRINIILIDLCQDIWLYISRNILIQKVNKKEVGSSTMPHKINPINFENAEGNFLLANSLLEFFSRKLPISRMQRDLTDSTILRNVGSAFSYTMIALNSLKQGLNKLEINTDTLKSELKDNFIVVAEGIQTRMKVIGIENSYEKMKEITRKNSDSKTELIKFIDESNFTESEKTYLKSITPFNYTGVFKLN